MAVTLQNPSGLILWDVIEEHLDEAEFLFERWNRALFQPVFNLHELARTFEPRLFAHIDALVIGGSEVAERILLPELLSTKAAPRATVAALALLAESEGTWVDAVLHAVQQTKPKPKVQAALIRALVLAESSPLDAKVQAHFRACPEDAPLLEILTGRGVDPGLFLRVSMESRDPAVAVSARNAVLRFGRRELYYLARINSLTGSPPPYDELAAQLQLPEKIETALWNLGFGGTVEAGDLCASYLVNSDLRLRKIAADSMAWIGGFDAADSLFRLSPKDAAEKELTSLPAFDDDDLDANLELDGVDALPIPNAEAITRWWNGNRDRLARYGRCLLGRPFVTEAVIYALREGPLWRRHSLALELCARTDGKRYVSTDAFSSRQIRQVAALAA